MNKTVKILMISFIIFQVSCGNINEKIKNNIVFDSKIVNNRPTKKVLTDEYYVKYVSDGDTITVVNKTTNKNIKVRLFGIDAPEITQEYGLESKEYLISLIKDKSVTIKGNTYDRYNRLLGTIYVDGININEMMVKTGNAWWYEKYDSKNTKVRDLEKNARELKLGLWKNINVVEPDKFREQKKKKKKT